MKRLRFQLRLINYYQNNLKNRLVLLRTIVQIVIRNLEMENK